MRALFLFLSIYCFAFDLSYTNYSDRSQLPDAVAVIAFNRPEYLKKLIQSLEQNPESSQIPFFFFLDGGEGNTQIENQSLVDLSRIANRNVVLREKNYGCPMNHLEAAKFLFDWCGFKRVVFIQEDLMVSCSYLQTLFRLHDWANEHYANIGTVQLWSYCCLNRSKKMERLTKVQEVSPHWSMVSYCIGKNVWDAISPFLSEYQKYILPLMDDPNYRIARSKPRNGPTARSWREWVERHAVSYDRAAVLASYQSHLPLWESTTPQNFWFLGDTFPMNQDEITSYAIWLAGFTRIQTEVNRAIHIGHRGISGDWSKAPISEMKLHQFAEDLELYNFKRRR